MPLHRRNGGFTLIELLVVIAIIAILAVVVVLTLNPAQLLAQSRDSQRVSDMATLQSGLNLYTTDQSGNLQLGNVSSTYISIYDPNASSTCGFLGLLALTTSTGQSWACASSSTYRNTTSTGWIGINFNLISAGSPFGNLPVDPINQTSTGLFYAYNTNGSQFEVTTNLESSKYKSTYGTNPQTTMFPEVVSGGTSGVSALYNSNGLIGYWPMDEGNGSTTNDSSGNGLALTFHNAPFPTWTTGLVGASAISFGGGSGNIFNNTTIFTLPTSGSFSVWVNTVVPPGFPTIFSLTNLFAMQIQSGTGEFYFGNSGGAGCTGKMTPNNWQMITGTWSFSNLKQYVYVNGAFCAMGTFPSPSLTTTTLMAVGQGLTGSLDDMRLYNRTLSAAEVAALYNAVN